MLDDLLLLGGVVSPLLYILVTIIGGELRPKYSHIKDTVSELFSPGSPNKKLLNRLILPYGVFNALFGVGMWLFVADSGFSSTLGVVASAFIILMGLINLLTGLVFLQDPMGEPITFSGKMHIVFVSMLALMSIATPILFGLWLNDASIASGFGVYSIITSIAIFVSGISTFVFAKLKMPVLGLVERITIAIFLQWSIVIAVKLMLIN